MNRIKLAIIGTKGIPANYGGFETCVDETSRILTKRGLDITVYCRNVLFKEKIQDYFGIKLKYIGNINTKNLATITATFISVLHVIFSKANIVHIYVSGNSIFIPILKLFGKKCVISVDALDWKRKKWGPLASKYIEYSEFIAVKFADSIISDSQHICDYYKSKYNRSIDYVSFGANILDSSMNYDISKYDLINNKYFLFVGIFRPEKNVDLLINAFNHAKTNDFKLVLIGDDPINPRYVNFIHSLKTNKIVFLGRIYGDEYMKISANAYCYISASEVEGTSPALVSAMGFNTPVLVSDIAENLETINDYGITFKNKNKYDLIQKIEFAVNNPNTMKNLSSKAFEMVKQRYTWDKIAEGFYGIYKNI